MSRGRSSRSGGRSGGGASRSGGFSRVSHSSGGGHVHIHRSSGGSPLSWLLSGMLISSNSNNNSTSINNSQGGQTNQPAVKYKKVKNKKATAIASIILGAICALFICLSFVFTFDNSYGKVMGTVVSVDEYYDFYDNDIYYFSSYDYVVDGVEYSAESKSGWTQLPDIPIGKENDTDYVQANYIGKSFELYYEKSNPYVIYEIEDKENIPSKNGTYIFMAVLMGIITIIVLCVGVNKYEIDTQYAEAMAKIKESQLPQGKVRCKYCDTKVDKLVHKCPSCGAPIK